MNELQLTQAPVAKAEMLIRKPVSDVWEAFIDPAITTKFWFTGSSGRLDFGQDVQWDWEMYGASAQVHVTVVEPHERLCIEWDSPPNVVEWLFAPHGDNATFVSIMNSGFHGDADSVTRQALDSTEAFTMVLAGCKALLEHNIRLNLVADRFPAGLET
jgi:uncharacterized protein YndB with AHSA1/START domain